MRKPSRPARESELSVTTRFPSGTVGLAMPGDCTTAVGVQYDTPLKLEGISSELQRHLGVGPSEIGRLRADPPWPLWPVERWRKVPQWEGNLQLLGPGVTITVVQAQEKTRAFHERENALELIA